MLGGGERWPVKDSQGLGEEVSRESEGPRANFLRLAIQLPPHVLQLQSSLSRKKTIFTSENQKAWLILESNTKDHGPETSILGSPNIMFQWSSHFMMFLWKQNQNDQKTRHSSNTLMERADRQTIAKKRNPCPKPQDAV